jgi:hypothetical protein
VVTTNAFPWSLILSALKMEWIRSSETSVLKDPHGAISQKTAFFIVTAVKTAGLDFSRSRVNIPVSTDNAFFISQYKIYVSKILSSKYYVNSIIRINVFLFLLFHVGLVILSDTQTILKRFYDSFPLK